MTATGAAAADLEQPESREETIERLAILLDLVPGAWVLMEASGDRLVEGILADLRQRLPALDILERSFLTHEPDPLSLLEAIPVSESAKAPVVVFRHLAAAMPRLFLQLDLKREALALLPHRLVFVAAEGERLDLLRHAPNFYSRIRAFFRFDALPTMDRALTLPFQVERTSKGGRLYPLRPPPPDLPPKEKNARIDGLRHRLEELQRSRNDLQSIATTLLDLGELEEPASPGRFRAAADYLLRAGRLPAAFDALLTAGTLAPNPAEASRYFEQAEALVTEVGSPLAAAELALLQGKSELKAGHLDRAEIHLLEARQLFESVAEPHGLYRSLGELSRLLQKTGRYSEAARLAEDALRRAEKDHFLAWVWIRPFAAALENADQLPAAWAWYEKAANARRQAGRPAVYVHALELRAASIAVRMGQVEEVLNTIEAEVDRVTGWWRRHRAGEKVAEAPEAESLASALMNALNIATEAHFAREDWAAALECLDSMLEVEQQLDRPAEEFANTRMNRATVLGWLGRFGEAKAELEACLLAFAGDRAMTAEALSSLAYLLNRQGDVAQAIVQERRALSFHENLPDPRERAFSHGNLANYLDLRGQATDLGESRWHRLASLVYLLVAGLGQDLKASTHNYGIRFRQARDAGQALEVPRLAELLADPAFASLAEWLKQREVDVEELQKQIDAWLAKVREDALASEGSTATSARQ